MAGNQPDLRAPTIATDGDISVSYMAALLDYLQQTFPGESLTQQPKDSQPPAEFAAHFASIMSGIGNSLAGVVTLFRGFVVATNEYQQTKDSFEELWSGAKEAWQQFIEGRDLDEPTDSGRSRTSVVLSLRAAQSAIEKFRIGNLKDTVNEQIQAIEDEILIIKTRATDLASGVAAYSGRPSAGGLAAAGAALNELQLAGSQARAIMAECLKLIKLFDTLTFVEDSMEADLFGQSKPQTSEQKQVYTRNP